MGFDEVDPTTTVAEIFAGFALELSTDRLPRDVALKTKLMILDGIGLCLAARHEEFAKMAECALTSIDSGGPCTVFSSERTYSLVHAPLVNGMLVHAYDFDDTHHPLVIHNESVVLPVVLAAAQYLDSSGLDVLTACAAGFEVSLRAARGGDTSLLQRRGFHPTSVCRVFGGAAAASRLFSLTRQQTVYALGLAASQGSGNMEWQSDGTWSKRFQPGWAAHASMMSVLLARQGFTASRTAIEGPRGFWAAHVGRDEADSERATSVIGQDWELERSEFKAYPCGGILQALVRSCVEVHNGPGFDPSAIVRVRCRVRWQEIGAERVNAQAPAGEYAAHFSIPFIAANALLKDRLALDDFSEEGLWDQRVRQIAKMVRIEDDPLSGRPKYASGEVEVEFKDGHTLRNRQQVHPGHVDNPLEPDDVLEKFRLNAARAIDEERSEQLADKVMKIETADDLNWLPGLLWPSLGAGT